MFYFFFGVHHRLAGTRLAVVALFPGDLAALDLPGHRCRDGVAGSVVFAAPSSNATICFIVVLGIMFAGGHLNGVAIQMGGIAAARSSMRCITASRIWNGTTCGNSSSTTGAHIDWLACGGRDPLRRCSTSGFLLGCDLAGFPPENADVMIRLVLSFCLSFAASRWPRCWTPSFQPVARPATDTSAGVLVALMGDSRRLFANQFFAMADVYFHSGFYPTIFDTQKPAEQSDLNEESHDQAGRGRGTRRRNFLSGNAQGLDRAFWPEFLSHRPYAFAGGNEREMLPWLKLSAEMDPHGSTPT